jgi:hypothetical protein
MGIQRFNDRFLGNAEVPATGELAGASPPAMTAKAVGTPPIVKADGTANPRANTQTKMAGSPSTPSTSKTHWPAKVDRFNGESV